MKFLAGLTICHKGTRYDLHSIPSDQVDDYMRRSNKVFKLGDNYISGPLASAKLLSRETGLPLSTVLPPSYNFDSVGREVKSENLKPVKV